MRIVSASLVTDMRIVSASLVTDMIIVSTSLVTNMRIVSASLVTDIRIVTLLEMTLLDTSMLEYLGHHTTHAQSTHRETVYIFVSGMGRR